MKETAVSCSSSDSQRRSTVNVSQINFSHKNKELAFLTTSLRPVADLGLEKWRGQIKNKKKIEGVKLKKLKN